MFMIIYKTKSNCYDNFFSDHFTCNCT